MSLTEAEPFAGIEDGQALAQAIVDTIREPLLVLDDKLRVVAASRSFYLTFSLDRQDVQGQPSTPSAVASGTSRSLDCFWRGSCRTTASWKPTRSSRNFPASAGARCC